MKQRKESVGQALKNIFNPVRCDILIKAFEKSILDLWKVLTEEEFERLPRNIRMDCFVLMFEEFEDFKSNATDKEKALRSFSDESHFIETLGDPFPAPVELSPLQWTTVKAVKAYTWKLLQAWNKNTEIFLRLKDFNHRVFPEAKEHYPAYKLPDLLRKLLVGHLSNYYKFCEMQREKLDEINDKKKF